MISPCTDVAENVFDEPEDTGHEKCCVDSLSTGAIIGIVISVAFVVIGSTVGIVCYIKHRKEGGEGKKY